MEKLLCPDCQQVQKFDVLVTHDQRIYTCTECGYQYAEPARARNHRRHHLAFDGQRWR